MIDLYAFPTPNSIKVPILLEELGLPYAYHPINVRAGEQKTPTTWRATPTARCPSSSTATAPLGRR
jgi:GST-like protein